MLYFFYLYFPFPHPLLLNSLQKNYMLFYSSCKVMFYNKNLLHSEIVTVPSDFRMLISQQSSTTPVQPAESINTKTEVFFMRELRNTKIIAVDHGYGNMKTANTVTPTGIKAYETEPLFCIIPYFP